MLLPPPTPIFHPRNSNQNQSKFPPQKIAYIQSKIEEKLAEIEIKTRKEIDKLFQKFSSQIRVAAAANQNFQFAYAFAYFILQFLMSIKTFKSKSFISIRLAWLK
jgi:hypothetical protein